MKTVDDATFAAEVLRAEGPVLVDFWAEWCGPCKAMAPAFEALSAEYAGRVAFVKASIDDAPEAGAAAGLRAVPTLVLFRGGCKVASLAGAKSRGEISRWLEGALAA